MHPERNIIRTEWLIENAAQDLIDVLSSEEFADDIRRLLARGRAAKILLAAVQYDNREEAAAVGVEIAAVLAGIQFPPGDYGFIYVLTDASGLFKIGRTADLDSRMISMRGVNPTVRLLAYFESKNAPEMERALHNAFRHSRVIGEWFDLLGFR